MIAPNTNQIPTEIPLHPDKKPSSANEIVP